MLSMERSFFRVYALHYRYQSPCQFHPAQPQLRPTWKSSQDSTHSCTTHFEFEVVIVTWEVLWSRLQQPIQKHHKAQLPQWS